MQYRDELLALAGTAKLGDAFTPGELTYLQLREWADPDLAHLRSRDIDQLVAYFRGLIDGSRMALGRD
jgi:hypothetical protein